MGCHFQNALPQYVVPPQHIVALHIENRRNIMVKQCQKERWLPVSYGRRKIFTDANEITAENVVKEVNEAFLVYLDNRNENADLYRYYRNKTAIVTKTKEVRENINLKICEAHCLEQITIRQIKNPPYCYDGF